MTAAELYLGDFFKVCAMYRNMRDGAKKGFPRPAMAGQEIMLFLVDPETLELEILIGEEHFGDFVYDVES